MQNRITLRVAFILGLLLITALLWSAFRPRPAEDPRPNTARVSNRVLTEAPPVAWSPPAADRAPDPDPDPAPAPDPEREREPLEADEVRIVADSVLVWVGGVPIRGIDINPILATQSSLNIRKPTLEAHLALAIDRSMAAQEAEHRGLLERADVQHQLGLVDIAFEGDVDFTAEEAEAYARRLKQQRLQYLMYEEAGADRNSVIEEWFDRLYVRDQLRYDEIAALEGDPRDAREEVADAMAEDFESEIQAEVEWRRDEVLADLRRGALVAFPD